METEKSTLNFPALMQMMQVTRNKSRGNKVRDPGGVPTRELLLLKEKKSKNGSWVPKYDPIDRWELGFFAQSVHTVRRVPGL